MKISYNWLKQFLAIDWPAEKTGEVLTDLGLEVEGLESFTNIPGALKGIVVGEVLTCGKHSNADKLQVTTVNLGNGEPVQIVCGAPNVAVGQKVAVATIGAELIMPNGEGWKIKKSKIRGEESFGMICSEVELNLGDDDSGILVLPEDYEVGKALSAYYEVEEDEVFEIGLTPNRSDAMSHYGVARDLLAGLKQQDLNLKLITPEVTSYRIDNRTKKIKVSVLEEEQAPRYAGLCISGVKVADSPHWLQNRLKAIGLAPINNIVDVTNYVLHELGQPLHAFDMAKIIGEEIIVKNLEKGTKFTTLDGVERTLNGEELMICDAEKPLAIAGVFGGENSGVSEFTSSVFLESAYFDPVTIRKAAKHHALSTDASFRFERGVDPNITEYALMRAAVLIKEIAGGEITSDIVDVYPKRIEDTSVFVNYANVNKIIGQEIPSDKIKSILSSLDIKVKSVTETGLGVVIPAYRNDVTREVDVVEEILRVYGYNKIAIPEKLHSSTTHAIEESDFKEENSVGNQLTAQGFTEILNNSLSSPEYLKLTPYFNPEYHVEIINPLSKELSVLRQTMLFGGLETIAYNINRRVSNLKLFEFGKTYFKYPNNRVEEKRLSILISGNKNYTTWNSPAAKTDFFYLKGIVLAVLDKLGIDSWKETQTENDMFTEGLSLLNKKMKLVDFGLINKKLLKTFDISQDVFYAEFYWDNIIQLARNYSFKLQPIPKYPSVKRDFALLIDEEVSFESLKEAAFKVDNTLLREVSLFDVYTGDNLPAGKKSYAVSFTLLDENETLTDKRIDALMGKLQKVFEKDFGASLR